MLVQPVVAHEKNTGEVTSFPQLVTELSYDSAKIREEKCCLDGEENCPKRKN